MSQDEIDTLRALAIRAAGVLRDAAESLELECGRNNDPDCTMNRALALATEIDLAVAARPATVTVVPDNIRADRLVACTDCGAEIGEACRATPVPDISHFARRLTRVHTKGVLEIERPDRGPWLALEKPS